MARVRSPFSFLLFSVICTAAVFLLVPVSIALAPHLMRNLQSLVIISIFNIILNIIISRCSLFVCVSSFGMCNCFSVTAEGVAEGHSRGVARL